MSDRPVFGAFALGPPGSGKTTFCTAMAQLMTSAGRRCAVINLDPANEFDWEESDDDDDDDGAGDGDDAAASTGDPHAPGTETSTTPPTRQQRSRQKTKTKKKKTKAYGGRLALDVRDLVRVEEIMARRNLGPNGALLFAVEYMLANVDWLERRLAAIIDDDDDAFGVGEDAAEHGGVEYRPPPRGGGARPPPPYLLFDLPGQVLIPPVRLF